MVAKFDAKPMGDTDSIMSKLGGEKYFTKIDMSKGYCYQFRRMPFGLINTIATSNRVVRRMLNNFRI